MTALVAVQSLAGFVLASDGRQTDAENGIVLREDAVKIGESSAHNLNAAWGWFGAANHTRFGVSFDLIKATGLATQSVANEDFSSLAEYAARVSTILYCMLLLQHNGKFPSHLYSEEIIAGLVFAGYANGRAQIVQVHFCQNSGTLLKPVLVDVVSHSCGLTVVAGSCAVYQAMERDGWFVPPKSLLHGEELARHYIQTCIDNNETNDECKRIGGTIRSTGVTPRGFDWMSRVLGS